MHILNALRFWFRCKRQCQQRKCHSTPQLAGPRPRLMTSGASTSTFTRSTSSASTSRRTRARGCRARQKSCDTKRSREFEGFVLFTPKGYTFWCESHLQCVTFAVNRHHKTERWRCSLLSRSYLQESERRRSTSCDLTYKFAERQLRPTAVANGVLPRVGPKPRVVFESRTPCSR